MQQFNKRVGTRFRQWVRRVLKAYLTRGYALNEKQLQEQHQKLSDQGDCLLLEPDLANRHCLNV